MPENPPRRNTRARIDRSELWANVREQAFAALAHHQRATTNLHLDERIIRRGTLIGPRRQNIRATRASVLVFADDDPMANFAHDCRYLLHDAKTGELDRVVPAVFPPWVKAPPETLSAFHQPVRYVDDLVFRPQPIFPCIRRTVGTRYAVLYAGMTNKRHLNDMEFLYRTLVDTYGFEPGNIYSLSYDGTLNTQDGVQSQWPGDNTNYRIQINGSGTRAALDGVVDTLKGRIERDDLLLIHTNNHGGWDGTAGTANLCTYPNWDGYYANDFAAKLGELPEFRKLIVMMEQCHAGGFNQPIIDQSPADATSVASAATEPNNSYVTADGNWDPFARDWVAAQAGHDCFGGALSLDPDTDHNGEIAASEAFSYADMVKDARDTPNFTQSSAAGGAIALGAEYTRLPWWCRLVLVDLRPWFLRIPPEEFYARLRRIEEELASVAAEADVAASQIEEQFTPQVREVLAKVFRA
ncbi:MAG: hypothetical protein WBV06_08750 [Acidimicrobiia bacterium]